MPFWKLSDLPLQEFRPGIRSAATIGTDLVMALMEIESGKEDTGHSHPFDQCGVVLSGKIEMFDGTERQVLGPGDAYFIPAAVQHGWKTFDVPATVLDVSAKG